jgi:hypothetical protein
MRLRMMFSAAIVTVMCSAAPAFAEQVVVSCGAGQHAVVRSANGDGVTRVQCVRNSTTRSSTYRTRYAAERPRRSWGKSALMIGGGAGTGAGVGAIVKGKRGALIGAALGGGAASIYESAKRR